MLQADIASLVNKEVVFTVNQYKDNLRELVSKCNEIDDSLTYILSCYGYSDIGKKIRVFDR